MNNQRMLVIFDNLSKYIMTNVHLVFATY